MLSYKNENLPKIILKLSYLIKQFQRGQVVSEGIKHHLAGLKA